MLPKSKKPGVMARLSTFVKGRSSKSAVEHSQLVAEIANTGSGPVPPHDPPIASIPLPPASKPTASSIQGSVSQTPMQSSVDKCQQVVEPLHPTADAICLAVPASTVPITRDASSQSPIRPALSGNEVKKPHDPRDGLPPSLAGSQPISLFEGAHDVHMGDFKINANHVNVFNEVGTEQKVLEIGRGRLGALPKHPDTSGKPVKYLPNSRKTDVDKLCQRESSSHDLVLCVHGPAGIGKSTLAGHLSDEFRSAGRLAAFISLGDIGTETSGPVTIVKMIANEIGCIHPRAIPKIVEAMDQCHGTSLENHLKKYILEPLRSLSHPQPLIIIMDAMDEWRDHRMFIEALAVLNSESSVVKFVLTDRLNPCAARLPGTDRVSIYMYALGPISKEVIKVYFQKYLEMVSWVDGRKASSADVEKLTELSGGLPVWASTVIVLLSHPFNESPPHEILAEIVGSRRKVGGSDGLGELYLNALRRLFPSPEAQKYFRQLIGATIILQEPLSLVEFSKLTGIPSHLINKIQFPLSALQTRSPPPGSEKMIHPATTLFHLSFLEYVQAPTTDASFAVSVFDSHTAIGLTCLNQLATLSRSSPDSNYPLRALQRYTVKYWLHHVFKGTPRSNDRWLQTKHCSTLQMISDSHGRWAALFLKSLMLGEVDSILEEVRKEDGMVSTLRKLADRLREAGGDYWGFQVACLEVAVRIDGGDAEGWSELGICYSESGRRTGNLWMHEEAVVAFRRTSHLRPDPHPECGLSLKYVATALWSCYQQNGESIILSEAISFSRMALTLCPTLHPDRHLYLSNLANVLGDFYGHNGSLEILNEVISLYRDALALCPASDSNYPSCINNLAASLHFLYRHNGDIAVLNEAISLHWEALALCPVRHPDYPFSINIVINLATSLQHLYHHNEDVDALNDAISLYHEALPLYPVPHPDRPRLLNSLANSLISLYHHNSDIDTLNEAISLHREALPLRPALHPDCPSALNDLANSLQSLYECNRDIDALTEAISLHREALGLRPASHLGHSLSLRNLASSLHTLHQHNNDLEALNECISLSHEGLALCPAPHPHRDSILRFLVQVYLSEFEQNGAIEALDEAISLYREVLVLCPPGRGYRAEVVQCLVQLLELRREVTGDDRDCAEVEDLRAKLEALEAGSSGIQPEERLSMAALVEETFDSESE